MSHTDIYKIAIKYLNSLQLDAVDGSTDATDVCI